MFANALRVGAVTLLVAGASPAITIFTDGFESNASGSNLVPSGWTVSLGTVDVLAEGVSFDCHTGARCVDLDGTSSNAGRLESATEYTFTSGVTYTLTFWLSRNQRGFGGPDNMTACLGTECVNFVNLPASVRSENTWAMYTIVLAGTDSQGRISFDHGGGDNVGLILDDVRLADSTVPEPGTFALLGTALACVGLYRRRDS
ncbi:MAG: PEP-CTERM sorting domain-containing protein [Bryobacteraceae bacterium]|nr:PEP-CTERM sorting domain-containing protein [Bryobacteraceae bacterium]